jgi:hypothetical protein
MVAADNLSPERSDELTYYPARSLGEAFKRYRRTDEWARKAPRTREDWGRGWRRIKPIFGDWNPLRGDRGDRFAPRSSSGDENLACTVEGGGRTRLLPPRRGSIAGGPQYSRGRSATWTEGEAVLLFKGAWRSGYPGLAALIAVA